MNSDSSLPGKRPPVGLLLAVDRVYRRRAADNSLAEAEFPGDEGRLVPVLHVKEGAWRITACRSRRPGETLLYCRRDDRGSIHRETVLTPKHGRLADRRAVHGKRSACVAYYEQAGGKRRRRDTAYAATGGAVALLAFLTVAGIEAWNSPDPAGTDNLLAGLSIPARHLERPDPAGDPKHTRPIPDRPARGWSSGGEAGHVSTPPDTKPAAGETGSETAPGDSTAVTSLDPPEAVPAGGRADTAGTGRTGAAVSTSPPGPGANPGPRDPETAKQPGTAASATASSNGWTVTTTSHAAIESEQAAPQKSEQLAPQGQVVRTGGPDRGASKSADKRMATCPWARSPYSC